MSHTDTTRAEQFEAGVLAYQSGLYEQAEALWLQVKSGPDFAQAAYNLAVMYEAGQGAYATNNNVVQWYRVAAEEGLAEAQFNYGGLFYLGERLPKKIEDAIYWWSQAGNQGHHQAQHNLGVLLFEGTEIPRDVNNAAQWFALASAGGYAPASEYLDKALAVLQEQRVEIAKSLPQADWDQHEMWLFHQDPADFTLELYRGASFEDAHGFAVRSNIDSIARYYLSGAKVVVVAGLFNTEQEARNALGKLTDDVKQHLPIPRQMSDVHGELRGD